MSQVHFSFKVWCSMSGTSDGKATSIYHGSNNYLLKLSISVILELGQAPPEQFSDTETPCLKRKIEKGCGCRSVLRTCVRPSVVSKPNQTKQNKHLLISAFLVVHYHLCNRRIQIYSSSRNKYIYIYTYIP